MSKMRLLFSQGLLLASCLLLSVAGCGGSAASNETGQGAPEVPIVEKSDVATATATATGLGIAIAARKQAADEGKYLFAFFSKKRGQKHDRDAIAFQRNDGQGNSPGECGHR